MSISQVRPFNVKSIHQRYMYYTAHVSLLNEALLFGACRRLPECVQELRAGPAADEVTVCSTNTSRPLFKRFMHDFRQVAEKHRLSVKSEMINPRLKGKNLMQAFPPGDPGYVAGPQQQEPNANNPMNQKITPRSVLFNALSQFETRLKNKQVVDFNDIRRLIGDSVGRMECWSIGSLVMDKVTAAAFLLTTAHGLGFGDWDSYCDDYTFLSTHDVGGQDSIGKQVVKVAGQFCGRYGPHREAMGQRNAAGFIYVEKTFLIDGLLLRADEDFLQNRRVSLNFIDPQNHQSTIDMHFYQRRPMEDLNGCIVYKYGYTTGLTVGVINDESLTVNISGRACGGVFSVMSAADPQVQQRFAEPGDSGSLVFGRHPLTGEFVAIGLVCRLPENPADMSVHCVMIETICRYLRKYKTKDIELRSSSTGQSN